MVMRKGRREAVGVGWRDDQVAHAQRPRDQVQCRLAAVDDNTDDRGGTAPLTPSFAATSREMTTATMAMMTMTTMTTTTTIASPGTIQSTGAAVLVPHLARGRRWLEQQG